MTGVLSTIHLRDPDPDRGTFAACGAGYPWPSSIALRDDPREVTCASCAETRGVRLPPPAPHCLVTVGERGTSLDPCDCPLSYDHDVYDRKV